MDKKLQNKLDYINSIETKELNLVVNDIPKASKRPRMGKYSFYVPDAAVNKKNIQESIKNQIPSDFKKIYTDIEIIIDCYIPMLKGFSKTDKELAELKYIRPSSKPDADNYSKTYLDALNGYLWDDDGQVVSLQCNKYYSSNPRVEMKIKYKTDFTSCLLKNRKNKKETREN